jgi:hypothetical protein
MPLVYCPECAKKISSLHHACPNCGAKFRDPEPPKPEPKKPEPQPEPAQSPKAKSRTPAVMGWVGALAGVVVLVLIGIICWLGAGRLALAGGTGGSTNQKSDLGEDAAKFIARYGAPDRDDSNQLQTPRPLMITRVLTYEDENVRVVFFPRVESGSQPPFKAWKLKLFQDTRDNAVLTSDQVADRLSKRVPSP